MINYVVSYINNYVIVIIKKETKYKLTNDTLNVIIIIEIGTHKK